LNKLLQLLLKL